MRAETASKVLAVVLAVAVVPAVAGAGEKSAVAFTKPPVAKRMPVLKDQLTGQWVYDRKNQVTSRRIRPNAEMKRKKARWKKAMKDQQRRRKG